MVKIESDEAFGDAKSVGYKRITLADTDNSLIKQESIGCGDDDSQDDVDSINYAKVNNEPNNDGFVLPFEHNLIKQEKFEESIDQCRADNQFHHDGAPSGENFDVSLSASAFDTHDTQIKVGLHS